jgi:hypothetical protein
MAKIKIKNNSSGGAVPSGLSAGELAVNLTDKKLYIGTSDISGSFFPFLPGVSAIAAGSGISLANGKTQGDVTIINAGVTSIFGLTGIVGLTGTDGITLSVSGRTLTIQGPGAGSGSGFTYYNGITTFAFGYQLKGGPLTASDTCKFFLSSTPPPGPNYLVNLTKSAANNNNTDKTTTNLDGLLNSITYSPTLHCVNERTKRVIVFQAVNTSTSFQLSGAGQLSLNYKTFGGQSESDFATTGTGVSGDWITIHFTLSPTPGGFAFTSGGGLCAASTIPTIITDTDGITHTSVSQEFLIDPTNITDINGASAIDEANDGFIFYDINATGTKLRKTTFKKAVLDSADTLFLTRTSSQILKGKDTSAIYFDSVNASTISGSDNGLLTGATAFKYLEANTVKSLNGNTGHVSINIVNTYNGRTGDVQGVSAAVGGTAISVSGATGSVTITNTGVWSINGSTGDITELSASTVVLGSTNINATRYLVFAATAGDQSLLVDNKTTPLSYIPNSGTIGAKVFEATQGSYTAKIDAPIGAIYVSDSSSGNVNTATPYGFEYNSAVTPYFFVSTAAPIFFITPSFRISDGDYDQAYGPSTWGYTFASATGASGQAMLTTGDGQLYWGNSVFSFNGQTGAVVGVSSFNGSTGAVVGVSSVNGQTGAVKVGRSLSVYAPTTSDNITMFYTTNALTLTNIESVLRGSAGPGVTFSVRYGTDRSAAGTEVVTSGIKCTDTTNGLSTTSFNNGTITGSSFVWLTVSGVSGTVNELSVTLEF